MMKAIRTLMPVILIAVGLAATPVVASLVAGLSAPTKLKTDEVSAFSVTLLWEAPENKGYGLDGYKIYRGDAVIATVSGLGSSYRDSGVEPATSYTYKIQAFDTKQVMSPLSAAVTVKTKAAPKAKTTPAKKSK